MTPVKVIESDDVLEALRLWHGGETQRWPLAHLRLSLQAEPKRYEYESLAGDGPAAINRAVLSLGLEELDRVSPSAHDLLRNRFEHQRDVIRLANQLNISESTVMYQQRQAIKQLADILLRLEKEAAAGWQEAMLTRLAPSTYATLVGIEEPRSALYAVLMEEDGHFLMALDGIGGIGKTALADRVARDAIETTRFDQVAWVTTKQTHLSTRGRLQVESGRPSLTFPMLLDRLAGQLSLPEGGDTEAARHNLVKRVLREQVCLVIVDNLETVADYRSLLPSLRQWQRPSKFLLTSRRRLLDEPGVYTISLRELPERAVYQLIRQEAERIGFQELLQATRSELRQIYDVVGGNPLAVKLLISQLRFYALPHVLERFSGYGADSGQEGIFDYIYREIWDSLDDDQRCVLLTLTEAGESGFNFDHLAAVTALPEGHLAPALEELILYSVVELAGTLTERRYRLHRLTEVFLLRMLQMEG